VGRLVTPYAVCSCHLSSDATQPSVDRRAGGAVSGAIIAGAVGGRLELSPGPPAASRWHSYYWGHGQCGVSLPEREVSSNIATAADKWQRIACRHERPVVSNRDVLARELTGLSKNVFDCPLGEVAMPQETDATTRPQVLIDLALQGGGSHGAFTWGVLDRLMEEPWLRIEAISGTSAGAMNAAVLADGWTQDGAAGARAALDSYWRLVARGAAFSPLQRSPLDRLLGRWSLDSSPAYLAIDLMTRVFSPYDLNPLGLNPLRSILAESIDFDRLARSPIKLFITATSVRTGRGRIFRNAEISADVLMASACLPTMFQAIEIDGEHYWDGGFAGNPTITPLVRESDAHDTILVQINPRERTDIPRTATDVLDRLNEISFNSPLMKELRMIALLRQVASPGHGEGSRWAGMRTHRIWTDKLAAFGASSKLNAEWEFLVMLKEEGRRATDRFLAAHADDLGKQSTTDLDVLLQEC
jgi:NTE family protein